MKIDLHIHSIFSHDGILHPAEIVRVAKRIGLDGIAITDHNTIRGGEEASQYETNDFKVIIGAEIMTDRGEITGIFLSQEIKSRRWLDVIAEIKGQGGLVIVPHPFDILRGSRFHIAEEHVSLIDAIEGFNSRCIFQRFNDRAVKFAVKYNLSLVAGSDAHYANEIGLGGIEIHSRDVREAILEYDLRVFGRRSAVLNHARTKIRKLWRKTAN